MSYCQGCADLESKLAHTETYAANMNVQRHAHLLRAEKAEAALKIEKDFRLKVEADYAKLEAENAALGKLLGTERDAFGKKETELLAQVDALRDLLALGVKALKAKIQMEGRGGRHGKLVEALAWRDNDELAQKMAQDFLAAASSLDLARAAEERRLMEAVVEAHREVRKAGQDLLEFDGDKRGIAEALQDAQDKREEALDVLDAHRTRPGG